MVASLQVLLKNIFEMTATIRASVPYLWCGRQGLALLPLIMGIIGSAAISMIVNIGTRF